MWHFTQVYLTVSLWQSKLSSNIKQLLGTHLTNLILHSLTCMTLRCSSIIPNQLIPSHQGKGRERYVNVFDMLRIIVPRLQKQHRHVWVLWQSRGEDWSSGPSSYWNYQRTRIVLWSRDIDSCTICNVTVHKKIILYAFS